MSYGGLGASQPESIWPRVETKGELEPAEREWLHTNGAGSYAMSTLALMHTRRYHGLLVAALDPPLRRYVIVSQLDTVASVGQRIYRLATHQFPNVAATPGYRLLESFAQDPIPRWNFRLGRSLLECRLCLARGECATVLSYSWQGPRRARLSVKPLFAMRPMHEVIQEHGGMIQTVSMRHGEVEIQPNAELPPVVVGHSGVFMGSPDWWRRFEYPVDRNRGVTHQEDLWTPGTFELDLEPGQTQYLVFGLTRLPKRSAKDCMAEACQVLEALDPGAGHSPAERRLVVAAEQFRADLAPRPGVIAGYPWLELAARDTLISLPGLYLVTGQVEGAKRVLRTLLTARVDGLLTRGFSEAGGVSPQPSADASLWLFEATDLLVAETGPDDVFVRDELYPALVSIFERVSAGAGGVLGLTGEGLVANGAAGNAPLTWMDSRADGVAVTPRQGVAVELQGLWGRALRVLARLSHERGDGELNARVETARQRLCLAFSRRFWCADTRYPYDCLSVEESGPGAFRDSSVRPNALIALALDPDLFTRWQAVSIIERVRERLLTPMGVRTLEPRHPDYRGDFRGPMHERQAAYHQGTGWVFLLGFFARAAFALDPNDFELQMEVRQAVERLLDASPVLGQIAQVASGDPPHHLGGCPAQAWSVAELLRSVKQILEP
ncbi:MAG TPA: amylo-alpha-1,6-glucosidase [Polyangiaceae bacterium]|nr:amylo-alpha-1,6-glucosidase [Polyangiaceae bacterium]